jgi:hypothetical protein
MNAFDLSSPPGFASMREPASTATTSGGASAVLPSGLVCPQCERASLVSRHCKTLCETCGYVESCEDNFLPQEENPQEK